MNNAKTNAVAVPDPVIGVRANGDADDYSFLHGTRWLMAIRVNGEIRLPQQERMLSRMADALGQELGLMERELTNAPAAPAQPEADEGFDEWYARVNPQFWNVWTACKAAFHAGLRSNATPQSSPDTNGQQDMTINSSTQPRACGSDKIRVINGITYSFGPRIERHVVDPRGVRTHVEQPAPGEKPGFWGLYAWHDDMWVWRADFATETSLHELLGSRAGAGKF